MTELYTLKTGANILLSFQAIPTDAVFRAMADPSAAVPPRDLALLFPGIQNLIAAEYRVTVKLGYHLKFKVVSEELTEECWKEKIEDNDKVSHMVWGQTLAKSFPGHTCETRPP